MTDENSTMELFRSWVQTLISGLEAQLDEGTKPELVESCGRACALHHGDIEKAKKIRHSRKGIDELLDQLNQRVSWCGKWMKDGETIYSVCERCGCPLVRASLVELSPTFCNCSRGWVKAVLDRPVTVELKQAIGRGDPVCQFLVHAAT